MSDVIVEVEGVSKSFGEVNAVDDFSFKVERGQVYGLLGPNGAGKSTTLRMITGLERPTSGVTRLFGTTVTPGCAELFRVGALVEQAAFVPHLSGMRNLQLWWTAGGARMVDADLDGALAIAGLDDAIHRKVKTYSQGMKQRLGFARLLLGRPELLILDEPTNGLDPGEIREIRELIGRLTEQGATVLLSSHHLSEVEQVCSHALVMNHGRLVTSGTVSDLVGTTKSLYLEVDDRAAAQTVLSQLHGVSNVQPQGDGLVMVLREGRRSDIAAALFAAGLRLETLMPTQRLEDAFLDLLAVGDTARDHDALHSEMAVPS
ncbi:MAG: ATP-binding cassette domain-containing protein [Ilumatobacteraceae bacterium]|nr:ATP-binding cassette domain-containing protein [Ilumatobacteraceae bacterium]